MNAVQVEYKLSPLTRGYIDLHRQTTFKPVTRRRRQSNCLIRGILFSVVVVNIFPLASLGRRRLNAGFAQAPVRLHVRHPHTEANLLPGGRVQGDDGAVGGLHLPGLRPQGLLARTRR